jgi:hypothetical protein
LQDIKTEVGWDETGTITYNVLLPKKIHDELYNELVSQQCLTGNGTVFIMQQESSLASDESWVCIPNFTIPEIRSVEVDWIIVQDGF